MKQRKDPRSDDPTVVFRKTAVWLFPSLFLIHTLFIYGVYPPFTQASLIAVFASAVVGLSTRWIRDLRTVHALAMFLLAFFMVYTMGVAAPVAFVALMERRDLIAIVGGASLALLATLIAWRTHVSLRRDWSLPLEQSPGIILFPHDNTLVKVAVGNSSRYSPRGAFAMLVIFVVSLFATHGTARYLFAALVVGPLFIAYIGCDLVSRMLAFLIVTRRWEIEHGTKLKAPRLR